MCWFGEQQSRSERRTAVHCAVSRRPARRLRDRRLVVPTCLDSYGMARRRVRTYLHLGEPTAFYEGGRIESFRLGEDGEVASYWHEGPRFLRGRSSLILVLLMKAGFSSRALVQVRRLRARHRWIGAYGAQAGLAGPCVVRLPVPLPSVIAVRRRKTSTSGSANS